MNYSSHVRMGRQRLLVGAVLTASLIATSCASASPPHVKVPPKSTPRKVLIVGDSLLFKDQYKIYQEIERDGEWDVVNIEARLGATTYRHQTIDNALANTEVDALILSFGYNEISDIRGNIARPVPRSAVEASWQTVVDVAKTNCLGWMTLQDAGWKKIGAKDTSTLMQMVRWMNNFIRTQGGKVLPVEWGPMIDINIIENWPNGSNLWVDSDGFHPKEGTWAKNAMGIKMREMLEQC